jgi:hypothetical protein
MDIKRHSFGCIKFLLFHNTSRLRIFVDGGSVRNGNLEVPVYFSRGKQGFTAIKKEKDK